MIAIPLRGSFAAAINVDELGRRRRCRFRRCSGCSCRSCAVHCRDSGATGRWPGASSARRVVRLFAHLLVAAASTRPERSAPPSPWSPVARCSSPAPPPPPPAVGRSTRPVCALARRRGRRCPRSRLCSRCRRCTSSSSSTWRRRRRRLVRRRGRGGEGDHLGRRRPRSVPASGGLAPSQARRRRETDPAPHARADRGLAAAMVPLFAVGGGRCSRRSSART